MDPRREKAFDPESMANRIKTRLRRFVDNMEDELRTTMDVTDPESWKRSESYRRFKANIVRSEIDSASGSTAVHERGNVHRVWSTSTQPVAHQMSAFDSPNGDDEFDRHQLSSGLSLGMSASAFVFLGKNYLKHVVDILLNDGQSSDEDVKKKLDTIQALIQIPASDICDGDYWTDFKTALRRLMHNSDDELQRRLCDATLRLLVKLFNSSNHNATVDSFALLADHLRTDVFSERIHISAKNERLQFARPNDVFVLQKLRILMDMCSGYVKILPRYSQQHTFRMAENMMALLDHPETSEAVLLTPLLAMSILDPRMKWWRYWMHGRLGRTAVLNALDKRRPFVEFLINSALDPAGTKLRTLQITASRSMIQDLLIYRECRTSVAQHLSNFPDDFLDRTLDTALEQNSKFAWIVCFQLASTDSGRILFLDDSRLKKLGAALTANSRKYHVKIRLLNFMGELLKSDLHERQDSSSKNRPRNAGYSIDHRGEMTTLFQSIMNSVSDWIIAAYSRDPDAPLSLVRACFNVCSTICRLNVGRRLIGTQDQFIIHAVKLVKEHSVEANSLIPILASITAENPECETVVRRFLTSSSVCELPFELLTGLLWYRPMELSANLGDLLRIDYDSSIRVNSVIHHLFLTLCNANGCGYLLKCDQFMEQLLTPFNADQFQETPMNELLLDILNLLLSRPDFAFGLRRRCDIAELTADLLRNYDDPECEFWIQTSTSKKLLEIYFKSKWLGGPSERFNDRGDHQSMTVSELLNCPMRFDRPMVISEDDAIPDGADPIQFIISALETKTSIPYCNLLMGTLKDVAITPDQTDHGDPTDSSAYELILDYGVRLGVLDSNPIDFSTFIAQYQRLIKNSNPESDWFSAVVYLIFNGNVPKAVAFLRGLVQSDSPNLGCVWPWMSSDFAVRINEIVDLVDVVLESELPRVVSALAMRGITISNLIAFWANQCFVNILDWTEVRNYLTLSVIGGKKYQVLFYCCLFRQMADEICIRSHRCDCDLHAFLIGSIEFDLRNHVKFLSYLCGKYGLS